MTAARPTAGITPVLTPELRGTLAAYRTCELVTVNRSGRPIAWPTLPVVRDDGTVVVTASIGMPAKAFAIRHEPRVALLFSDPTGSGLDQPDQVLVRGRAECPETLHTSPAGLEDWWREAARKQPGSPLKASSAGARRFAAWYFVRLAITVTPEHVERSPLLTGRPPGSAPAGVTRRPRRGEDAFATAARELAGFGSAVLATLDPDGSPRLTRVRPEPDPGSRTFGVAAPAGAGSPASLLWHEHDEALWDLRVGNVLGTLEAAPAAPAAPDAAGAVRLRPERLAGAGSGPIAALRHLRRCSREADAYLARRGLARPEIDWAGLAAVQAAAVR